MAPQYEKKDHSTPFVYGSRTGQVNDYSGYDNHSIALTEVNTPQWVVDNKIGTGGYKFIASKQTYIQPASYLMSTYKGFTTSAWIYLLSEPTDTNVGYVITQHYGGGG